MRFKNLVPGNLFKYTGEDNAYMLLDNKSFAIGGEHGDVNKPVIMRVDGDTGSLAFADSVDLEVVLLDVEALEEDTDSMDRIKEGSFFMHDGLGEILVKTNVYAGRKPNEHFISAAVLCARAKDGTLVMLPDRDTVTKVKVLLKE